MGPSKIDESKQVPDFIEHNYWKAVDWAKKYGVPYSIDFDTDVEGKVGDVVKQTPEPGTAISAVEKLRLVVKAGEQKIKFDANGHGSAPSSITVITGDDSVSFPSMSSVTESNGDTYNFIGWFTSPDGGEQVYNSDNVSGNATVYAHWEKNCNHQYEEISRTEPTCEESGSVTKKCAKCGKEVTETLDSLGHDWDSGTVTKEATSCDEDDGEITYTCGRCGKTYVEHYRVTGSACSAGSGDGEGSGETEPGTEGGGN